MIAFHSTDLRSSSRSPSPAPRLRLEGVYQHALAQMSHHSPVHDDLRCPVRSLRAGYRKRQSIWHCHRPRRLRFPDAEVKITATDTNAERVVTTNNEGNYVAPQLPFGTYTIQVTKQGFSIARATGIVVRTNETVRRNFQLELGSVATSVDVSAAAELTNTYTAQLSQTVDQRRIVELPLNGRDVTQLSLMVAGATVTDASTSFYAGTSGFDTTTAVINGNRTQSNTYLLDGMGNQFMERRVANIYPNPDAVEEFTLNTSQYSAEMGGNPGGQLSAVTKKGTNQLHGSLFEFVRNGVFNARNALDTRGTNDGLKRNQYGWAVGGPLYIPKIIDGRNRFFWMNSYQSTPDSSARHAWIPSELDEERERRRLLRASDRQNETSAFSGVQWIHADRRYRHNLRSTDRQLGLWVPRDTVYRQHHSPHPP